MGVPRFEFAETAAFSVGSVIFSVGCFFRFASGGSERPEGPRFLVVKCCAKPCDQRGCRY